MPRRSAVLAGLALASSIPAPSAFAQAGAGSERAAGGAVLIDGQPLTVTVPGTDEPRGPFRASPSGSWTAIPEDGVRFQRGAMLADPVLYKPRIRVIVQTRGEAVDVAPDGRVQRRRGTVEPDQITAIRQALATFALWVRGTTRNTLPEFTVVVDDEPMRLRVDAPGDVLNAERLTAVVRPAVNEHPFEADDQVDRGPFDAVFVVTALPVAGDSVALVDGTPAAWVPAYTANAATEPDALAQRFARQWRRLIELRTSARGWLPLTPEALSASDWSVVNAKSPETDAVWRDRRWPAVKDAYAWADIQSDVWSRLPRRDSASIRAAIARVDPTERAYPRLNDRFAPELEAIGIVGQTPGGQPILAVRADAFPSLMERWPADRTISLLGQAHEAGHTYALVTTASPLPAREAAWLNDGATGTDVARLLSVTRLATSASPAFQCDVAGVPGQEVTIRVLSATDNELARMTFTLGDKGHATPTLKLPLDPAPARIVLEGANAESLPVQSPPKDWLSAAPTARGRFSLETLPNGDAGTRIVESGDWREGGVRWSAPVGLALASLSETPVLKVRLRRNARDPLAIRLLGPDGADLGYIHLGPGYPRATEDGPDSPVAAPQGAVDLPNDEAWHDLAIDLTPWLPAGTWVAAVEFVPAPRFGRFERQQNGRGTLDVDSLKFDVAGSGTPLGAPMAQPALVLPDDRQAGLASPDDAVVLTTLEALRKAPDPAFIETLTALARSSNPVRAEMAVAALAAIPGDAAGSAINEVAAKAVFEPNRTAALRALVQIKRPVPLSSAGTLFTARTRAARRAALAALATSPEREAGLIGLALLRDISPDVRLDAVALTKLDLELANRRLLFTAVNDPSEAVRKAAVVRLLESPIPEIRQEAARAVRDDSPAIRIAVLNAIQARPHAQWRATIQLGLADISAPVRAAAVRAFAAQPGEVDLAALGAVLQDADPRVQAALLDAVAQFKWPLPATAWDTFRMSLDPEVAQRARELGP